MFYVALACEILLSVLAVFALYVLFRTLYLAHFAKGESLIAVRLTHETTIEEVARLFERARENCFFCGNCRIIFLVPSDLSEGEIAKKLSGFGAEILFLK